MSRNAKATYAKIFDRLTAYVADHDLTMPSGQRRIFLEEDAYTILLDTKRIEYLRIGRRQAAALLQTTSGRVLAISGFDAQKMRTSPSIREMDWSPGIAVAAIADLEVEPKATPLEVVNIVAAGSADDSHYQGHDLGDVQPLFPPLRLMEIDSEIEGTENFAANLLTFCAAEGADGNGWINKALADELVGLAEQHIAGLPYEFLVRATLDLDPKNLFLALYRCLEATYAFTRASELAEKLGINDRSWFDVAKALGESLSWYPRHDQSLAAILDLPAVSRADLDELAASLGKEPGGDGVATRVASGVRELRNSLVHYGPTTRPVTVPDDDWNRLCAPLARVVGQVFSHTYGGQGTTVMP